MNFRARTCLARLLLFLTASLVALAQPAPAPKDTTLSPYFWVKSEDPSVDALPLKSTQAQVDIAGVIARVKVTQIYKNEGRHALEAIYVFPASTRAAVHSLTMTVGDRVIRGQVQARDQARRTYEQAKAEGRSATLLEEQRPNVLQMNVANILPGDEIKVELAYTELLVPTEGTYEFVYPTVVGPRYASQDAASAPASERWSASPYTKAGEAPLSTFGIAVKLAAGLPIQELECPSHRTRIEKGATSAEVALDSTEAAGGNRDFILHYRLAGGAIQSGLLLFKGREENFFLLMAQPPKRVAPESLPPREYIFILDVSGSMNGYPLDTAKALLTRLVSGLRPQDRFNVEVFESGTALWSERGSRPGTPENLKDALAFIHEQSGSGGTEIMSALKRALALPRTAGMSRTLVVATDAYITVDAQVIDIIRDHLGEANVFAFGIGTSVNRHLIEGMAHAGMGEAFVVTRPEEAQAAADRFRAYIDAPVLTQVRLDIDGFDAYDIEPLQLPDVLAERPVLCFGKWRGQQAGTLQLTGTSGAGAYAQRFWVSDVVADEANEALRYLWARHRIQLLGDYRAIREDEARRKEILDLGLKYNLLTDQTSFVAVDSLVRNPSGESMPVAQPLPMPQGVSNRALGSISYFAPGVTGSGYGSATVEVSACCAAAITQDVVAFQVPRPLPASPKGPRLGTLSADRPMDLAALRIQLEKAFRQRALASLLRRAGGPLLLTLDVTAQGEVRAVTFDRELDEVLASNLKANLLALRLEVPGGASRIKVEVLP
ncbi:MAG TPA: VIT domain-containing protein [Holophagaceae bacterium]|nr:VIT domain-containing protein [Holophagaceae bacterium]